MPRDGISLDDKYLLDQGRIFITGNQALVRLPLVQRRIDRAAGLNTAGFISGYRGSPLGNYDAALWSAKAMLERDGVVFVPGVNEELAATSVWGSQQVTLMPGAKHDGVFGIWYGKGPGVYRAGDALKHGNLAGTSRHGGVVVLAGDDHSAKSSTTAHQSEQALMAALIPVLNPASVQDYLDLGPHAVALSRFAGLWVGFKCLTETVESGATCTLSPDPFAPVLPEIEGPPDGRNIKLRLAALADEASVIRWRLPAAQAYIRANGLDRVALDGARRGLGIVAVGKSFADLREALALLRIDGARAAALGLRIYKPALTWPLEPDGLTRFAHGHREILVLEEKRPFVEEQAARILYHLPADARPALSGKATPEGRPLLRSDGELSPMEIAGALMDRLTGLGLADADLTARWAELAPDPGAKAGAKDALGIARTPGFCSGCPHNTSTKVPEGSMALAGIGCHTMAMFLPDRPTAPPTQMGGEGVNWIGMAPFTDRAHVFQNLGDGTYFHSGLIAVRAAVAARVNITYKILYNDAVAMTGGQPVDGTISVPAMAAQLAAEGVGRIAVVSDQPEMWQGYGLFPHGTTVHHRDDLDAVQTDLRDIPGVTALIYVQTCAAEKRRRRKRKEFPDPPKRMFINEHVCEGCGDCSVQSNCVSIQPVETPLGRKRRIDQSSCNKDFSCTKGFCPSFVTVEGGSLRKAAPAGGGGIQDPAAGLPLPDLPAIQGSYGILITGIGGTGVVTIGAILSMAAHLEGKGCSTLDLTGLSQKNGAVFSHVRIAADPADLTNTRIGPGRTDLLLGCDLLVAGGAEARATLRPGISRAIVNSAVVPTAAFQQNPDMDFQSAATRRTLAAALGDGAMGGQTDGRMTDGRITDGRMMVVEATDLATRLMGDAIAANMMMLGAAWQAGAVPVGLDAITRAVRLNGVAVSMNLTAFAWGRRAIADPDGVRRAAGLTVEAPKPETLDDLIDRRVAHLTAYQDGDYARTYLTLVQAVRAAEARATPGRTDLTAAVARGYAKLMAYKDEYEVARLYANTDWREKLGLTFDGPVRLRFNLAPPLLTPRDAKTGLPRKMEFGSWMLHAFRLLARFKGLRGTRLDPFGWTEERRMERRLIGEYRAMVEGLLPTLSPANHATAVALARVPEKIRGFGHVKERHLEKAKAEEASLLARYHSPAPVARAAE
ncbi:MAG: hypothetical protein RLY86_1321 [Pseudomonadota bacterium]